MSIRPRWGVGAVLVAAAMIAACHPAITHHSPTFMVNAGDYAYPLADPYAATVVGTPARDAVDLPREVPVDQLELTIFKHRWIPEIFWYEDEFRYSAATQSGPAPLIFIVAGSNAGHNSRFSVFLQKLFYTAGFHAISISSPTYPNFIATASTTACPAGPGRMRRISTARCASPERSSSSASTSPTYPWRATVSALGSRRSWPASTTGSTPSTSARSC